MDEPRSLALRHELDRFLDRCAPLLGRDGNQPHARRFVQGPLHGDGRRNAENISQATAGGPVRSLQAFVTAGAWPDAPVLAEMRRPVLEAPGDDDAVRYSDETGSSGMGARSVDARRRHSGTPGRADDRPVAVLANRAASGPGDGGRGGAVPPGRRRRRPRRQPRVRGGIRQPGELPILDGSADARVRLDVPRVIPVEERPRPGRGRRCTRPSVLGNAGRVDEMMAALPAAAWRRRKLAEGSRGSRACEYAAVRAWFGDAGPPVRRERLLVRRSPVLQRRRLAGKESRMTVLKVRALPAHLLNVRDRDVAETFGWSASRRERNRRAAASHRNRRMAESRRRKRNRPRVPAPCYQAPSSVPPPAATQYPPVLDAGTARSRRNTPDPRRAET